MKNVCDYLRELVGRGHALLAQSNQSNSSQHQWQMIDRDYTAWVANALQVMEYAELSSYAQRVTNEDLHESRAVKVPKIAGLIQSALECLERGFVGKLKHVLQAELFGSVATQARELLRAKHMLPAAVLGRIALERWLRDTAQTVGIADYENERAAKLNDALKGVGKLTQPKWRLIQHFLDVGNTAAHGKDDQFSAEDVTRMLDFIEANCLG